MAGLFSKLIKSVVSDVVSDVVADVVNEGESKLAQKLGEGIKFDVPTEDGSTQTVVLKAKDGVFGNSTQDSNAQGQVVPESKLFDYEEMSDGNIRLKACKMESDDELVIPDTIKGKKVTVMGSECMGYSVVNRVVCPKYLEVIEDRVFRKSNVKEIVLNEGLRRIGEAAFNNTGSLKALVMPDSVVEVGKSLFVGSGVETVKLSAGLSSFPEECFAISSLKEITIPGNIKTISERSFRDCFKLETVILEEGVEAIESKAFAGDHKLKSIVMPASLKRIVPDFIEICLQEKVYNNLWKKCEELEGNNILNEHYASMASEIFKVAQKVGGNLPQVLSDANRLSFQHKFPRTLTTHLQTEAMKTASTAETPMMAFAGMSMGTMQPQMANAYATQLKNQSAMNEISVQHENPLEKALENLAARRTQVTQMILTVKPGSYAQQYAETVGFEYVSA